MRNNGRALQSLAPTLVDGVHESDELPFVMEEATATTALKNGNVTVLGDLTYV
jgi:hypothetical protein